MPEAADPRPEGPPPDLGARIRAAREGGRPLGPRPRAADRRLAESASQVERGLAQPSVATLWALVTELGLSLDGLFAAPEQTDGSAAIVQRARSRPALELEGGIVWERLTAAPDRDADFAFVTYPPGADSGADDPPASHGGREYGYVIGGRCASRSATRSWSLAPGTRWRSARRPRTDSARSATSP